MTVLMALTLWSDYGRSPAIASIAGLLARAAVARCEAQGYASQLHPNVNRCMAVDSPSISRLSKLVEVLA